MFDISDIHKARRIGRTPYLWKMEPEHQEMVIDHLEHIYGGTRQDKGFEERLLEIAQRITLDCYEEVWEDLQYLTEGSYLEGLDEYFGKVHLRETMQSSISYTLLACCGMDMENYEELLNFDYIHEFNTVPALSQLGSNITELCKPVLLEIGKAIRAYDREISKKRVANHNNLNYNALKHESVKQNTVEDANENPENSRNEERSQDYGTDISEERRLLHPEYQNGRAASGSADQIRDDEEDISAGTQEEALLGTSADRQADEPSVGDSGSGRAEDGENHGADGSGRGSDRGTEIQRSDEMDSAHEQHPSFSGGDRTGRTDLQLEEAEEISAQPDQEMKESDSEELPDFFISGEETPINDAGGASVYEQLSFFPSAEEQVGNIAINHANDMVPFSMGKPITDEMVDYVLLTGGGQRDSRPRIFAKYQKWLDSVKMSEFLNGNMAGEERVLPLRESLCLPGTMRME